MPRTAADTAASAEKIEANKEETDAAEKDTIRDGKVKGVESELKRKSAEQSTREKDQEGAGTRAGAAVADEGQEQSAPEAEKEAGRLQEAQEEQPEERARRASRKGNGRSPKRKGSTQGVQTRSSRRLRSKEAGPVISSESPSSKQAKRSKLVGEAGTRNQSRQAKAYPQAPDQVGGDHGAEAGVYPYPSLSLLMLLVQTCVIPID